MTYTLQFAGDGLAHILQLLEDSSAEFAIERRGEGYYFSTDDNDVFDLVFIDGNHNNYTIQLLEETV